MGRMGASKIQGSLFWAVYLSKCRALEKAGIYRDHWGICWRDAVEKYANAEQIWKLCLERPNKVCGHLLATGKSAQGRYHLLLLLLSLLLILLLLVILLLHIQCCYLLILGGQLCDLFGPALPVAVRASGGAGRRDLRRPADACYKLRGARAVSRHLYRICSRCSSLCGRCPGGSAAAGCGHQQGRQRERHF